MSFCPFPARFFCSFPLSLLFPLSFTGFPITDEIILISKRQGYKPSFDFIWFYVLNEKIEDLIEAAAEDLSDEEFDRVSVYVENDLRASRFR